MANVFRVKRKHGLRSAESGNKLDLHGVRCKQFDNCTQVAATQPSLGDVMSKSDGIKQFVHGLPRKYGH